MNALNGLPARDLEQLSAYADGELAPREADRLRERLEREDGLRQALHELRLTSELLRSMPALHAPRSFALPPERAKARIRYPRLQLATALASLAFVLVLGVDLLTGSALRAAPLAPAMGQLAAPAAEMDELAAQPAEQPVELPAPAEELQLAPAGTPSPLATRAEGPAAEQELPAAGEPEAAAEQRAESDQASAAEQPAEGESAATPEQAAGAELGLAAPTPTQAVLGTSAPPDSYADAVATPEPQATSAPAGGEIPQERAAEAERAAELEPQLVQPEQRDGRFRVEPGALSLVRLLEAGLAAAALTLGLFTVRARRRR